MEHLTDEQLQNTLNKTKRGTDKKKITRKQS
jgi:hypothetical protein